MRNNKNKEKIVAMMLLIWLFLLMATSIYASPNPLISEYINIDVQEFLNSTSTNNILEPKSILANTLKVENKTSAKIYYCIYLDNLEGNLKEQLMFYVYEDEVLVYSNKAINFSEITPFKPQPLEGKQVHIFYIAIQVIESDSIHKYQGEYLNFDIIIHPYKP